MEKTYPVINNVSPNLLKETTHSDVETVSMRAIYEFDSLYITIKPKFNNVSSKSELTSQNVEWVIHTGETENCMGKTVGPFNSVEKAVDYIKSTID